MLGGESQLHQGATNHTLGGACLFHLCNHRGRTTWRCLSFGARRKPRGACLVSFAAASVTSSLNLFKPEQTALAAATSLCRWPESLKDIDARLPCHLGRGSCSRCGRCGRRSEGHELQRVWPWPPTLTQPWPVRYHQPGCWPSAARGPFQRPIITMSRAGPGALFNAKAMQALASSRLLAPRPFCRSWAL